MSHILAFDPHNYIEWIYLTWCGIPNTASLDLLNHNICRSKPLFHTLQHWLHSNWWRRSFCALFGWWSVRTLYFHDAIFFFNFKNVRIMNLYLTTIYRWSRLKVSSHLWTLKKKKFILDYWSNDLYLSFLFLIIIMCSYMIYCLYL